MTNSTRSQQRSHGGISVPSTVRRGGGGGREDAGRRASVPPGAEVDSRGGFPPYVVARGVGETRGRRRTEGDKQRGQTEVYAPTGSKAVPLPRCYSLVAAGHSDGISRRRSAYRRGGRQGRRVGRRIRLGRWERARRATAQSIGADPPGFTAHREPCRSHSRPPTQTPRLLAALVGHGLDGER